jgi:hypothetical protein
VCDSSRSWRKPWTFAPVACIIHDESNSELQRRIAVNRRRFLQVAVPLGVAGIAVAQEKAKPDRLSGYVESMDKAKNTIVMHTRAAPTVKRNIMFDENTKVLVANKPGNIDEVKEGMRIVAIGKFQGVDLKATDISVRPR